jgi:3-oxoacyl-[acyl-carrier protein] reductase
MSAIRNILVTGATGGIGSRVCSTLLGQKVSVVGAVRDEGRFKDLMNSRSLASKTLETVKVDFANSELMEQASQALSRVKPSLSGIVLIYPGIPKTSDTIPPPEAWRDALNLCFVNPLGFLRAAIDYLEPDARIVLVSGISGIQVFPSLPFSNAIRAAWLAEAKTLSFALASRKIRVNTLSLGGTLTERFKTRLADRKPNDIPMEDSPDNIPLGSYGDPDDVAKVVCSLLGEFSNHMTGANIVMDGGLTRVY